LQGTLVGTRTFFANMKIFSQCLAFVPVTLLVSSTAFAQEGDPPNPPSEARPAPEATAASEATPASEARPASEAMADACSWQGRCAYPHLVFGVDAGVSHFNEGGPFGFKTGTGSITSWGPAWGLRGGVEVTRWFAVEAHYIGTSNHADDSVSVGGSRGLLTNAIAAELRFTLPTPYVQPYFFFGPGWYSTSITGSSTTTELTRSSEFGVPIGVGFQVPLPRGLTLGAEATYHRLFGESFSENEDIGGGEPTSINAVLRFRL
jgi:Outer membrane protein beta-barrel domain